MINFIRDAFYTARVSSSKLVVLLIILIISYLADKFRKYFQFIMTVNVIEGNTKKCPEDFLGRPGSNPSANVGFELNAIKI